MVLRHAGKSIISIPSLLAEESDDELAIVVQLADRRLKAFAIQNFLFGRLGLLPFLLILVIFL